MQKVVKSKIEKISDEVFLLTLKVNDKYVTAGAFTSEDDEQTALNICYTFCKKVYGVEVEEK